MEVERLSQLIKPRKSFSQPCPADCG